MINDNREGEKCICQNPECKMTFGITWDNDVCPNAECLWPYDKNGFVKLTETKYFCTKCKNTFSSAQEKTPTCIQCETE